MQRVSSGGDSLDSLNDELDQYLLGAIKVVKFRPEEIAKRNLTYCQDPHCLERFYESASRRVGHYMRKKRKGQRKRSPELEIVAAVLRVNLDIMEDQRSDIGTRRFPKEVKKLVYEIPDETDALDEDDVASCVTLEDCGSCILFRPCKLFCYGVRQIGRLFALLSSTVKNTFHILRAYFFKNNDEEEFLKCDHVSPAAYVPRKARRARARWEKKRQRKMKRRLQPGL